MAYPLKLEKLVGAALMRDHEFRMLLLEDPAAAARSAGIRLTKEEVERIKASVQHLDAKKLEASAEELRRIATFSNIIW